LDAAQHSNTLSLALDLRLRLDSNWLVGSLVANDEPMDISDPPFMVMRRINGRLEFEVGPCESLEKAIVQTRRCLLGELVITQRGRVVWPEGPTNKYS
jgi:hypothetical protein